MNERLFNLTGQAISEVSVPLDFKHEHFLFATKFAELIVRECMKCSDPLVSHYINTHTEQEQAPLLAAIADYSSEIKKHFGVEE